jgi:hypothetical protein
MSAMSVTRSMNFAAVVVAFGIAATSTSAQNATVTKYMVRTLPLPDNGTGDVSMDYIAFDPTTNSLWVPGGNTGAVDVIDVTTDKVRQILNLPTAEVQARGGCGCSGRPVSPLATASCTSATAADRRFVHSTPARSRVWRVSILIRGLMVSRTLRPPGRCG